MRVCAGVLASVWPYVYNPPRAVDKEKCTCDCFDGLFKGPYSVNANQLKLSLYFNMEKETLLIFVWAYVYLTLFQRLLRCAVTSMPSHARLSC
jgi:hypothetical protein